MELNQLIVTDKGIEQVDQVYYSGEMYCSKLIIPKEIIIEAYNKFIKGNKDTIYDDTTPLKVKDVIAHTWWSQPVAIFNTKNRIEDITTANQLKAISDKWCKADDLDEYDNEILEKDVLGFGVVGKRLAIEYFDKENNNG